jgi:hypothetical protein
MAIVLRASSSQLDLQASFRWLPADRIEAVWRVGDLRGSRLESTNGFSVRLSASEDTRTSLAEALSVFSGIATHVKELSAAGAALEVDVALYVTASMPQSVELRGDFLAALLEANVRLLVTGYPCSDEP